MTDYYTRKSLRCNELQKNIKVQKDNSEVYLIEMMNNVSDQKMDQLISNIGSLGNTLKSTFEMVGEQADITKEILDHMKSTET
ncbi:hypothetical protein C1645_771669, partial [Glomus cerebriforme]